MKLLLIAAIISAPAIADPPTYNIANECRGYNPNNIENNPEVKNWNSAACIGTEYAFRDFVLSQWPRYSEARHTYCTEWNAKTPTNFAYMALLSCLLAGQVSAREEEWGGPD